MKLSVKTKNTYYDIIVERHSLNHVNDYFSLDRKVLVITDDGVPTCYFNQVLSQLKNGYSYIIPQGEASKNFEQYKNILTFLVEHHFTRDDALIALGGGVVGDLTGFVASTYMRGMDFYNIPTTLLSQVDSSIGGKTAIDLGEYKNMVGSFYAPKKVLIDVETLKTLDERQFYNGLIEAIKMSLTHNPNLFNQISQSEHLLEHIEEIVYQSLLIKKMVVEEDEFEKGNRRVLNFGHTVGHALESHNHFSYLHGECVAMGMLFFTSQEIRNSLIRMYQKYHLPMDIDVSIDAIFPIILHDKKATKNIIQVVFVKEIGQYEIVKMSDKDLYNYLKEQEIELKEVL